MTHKFCQEMMEGQWRQIPRKYLLRGGIKNGTALKVG